MPHLSDHFDSLTELYTANENVVLGELLNMSRLTEVERDDIGELATRYVTELRSNKSNMQLIDTFLQEYGLSTPEGLTLMRLAEALIRTPDFATSRLLMRDKLSDANWSTHAGQSESLLVNQTTSGLRFVKTWIKSSGGNDAQNLAARLGDRVMGAAVAQAMAMMGQHFVLGRDIKEATHQAKQSESQGFSHSYDMLGEAAYTQEDADKYYQAYLSAVKHLAKDSSNEVGIDKSAGISIKLSALHPRYEYAKRDECVPVLVSKTIELAKIAKSANLSLTIDAEEVDRLEVSLLIFERLLQAPDLADWDGLGLVIQSYQKRASRVITHVIEQAKKAGRKITIRLVKGAYWDMEIKRAQELGLESYPVFTRKENTDVSYIACARLLLDAPDVIYSQFATHNALTAATIVHMAAGNYDFEFQRLHGMGEALHKNLITELGVKSRIYAPVGSHKDLLPYLVRRLLENGANSSFVNQLFEEDIEVSEITEDPFKRVLENENAENDEIPAPRDLFNGERQAAAGLDVTQSNILQAVEALESSFKPYHASRKVLKSGLVKIYNPANAAQSVGSYLPSSTADIDRAIQKSLKSKWSKTFTAEDRAACIEKLADALEADMDKFLQLCTFEAGKSYLDGVAEVREAVDFCRYYAAQARRSDISKRTPLGIVACISPWNFPLAIFLGQVVAALSVGNTVIAKPAEQTPLIAHRAMKLLYAAGVPKDAVQLVMGDGAVLGSHLSAHKDISAICFTGSTATAKKIAANLARTQKSTIPFIAETGGINAMIVDSTALLEQAVNDIISSAFQSAGQRCSACRFVCIQDDIADDFMTMLSGAMNELTVGNPAQVKTDVGPVIDALALKTITEYIEDMKSKFTVIGESPRPADISKGHFIPPVAFELGAIADLSREIFGPVLHLVRFKSSDISKVIDEINALGFGLTMGLHTRLSDRVEWVSQNAHIGNLYVNRNQIGAVVGVQPFGGEGLSGTGPKAGGPHYLLRLTANPTSTKPSSANDVASSLSLKSAVPSQDAIDRINAAKDASQQWAEKFTQNERRDVIKSLFAPLAQIDDALIWPRLNYESHMTLPGPTGESNILELHPRGVILCLGDLDDILQQMTLALSAGNSVIALPTSGLEKVEALSQTLSETTGLQNLISLIDLESLEDALNSPIDGVAVDGTYRETIGEFLCLREGAILPILRASSVPQRFAHERTVTINTTAAGGNASLLTMTPS